MKTTYKKKSYNFKKLKYFLKISFHLQVEILTDRVIDWF